MRAGNLIRVRSFKHYFPPQTGDGFHIICETFTADKGRVFVAALLGTEPQDGSEPLNVHMALGRFGWILADGPTCPVWRAGETAP